MGKRSNFERVKNDFYPTPHAAVLPLICHLDQGLTFMEPCAGNGALIRHLQAAGLTLDSAYDIDPRDKGITKANCLDLEEVSADIVITNPPWDRPVLHRIIHHFRTKAPTWLLFDADWANTNQAIQYLEYCEKIVSVGRVKWIEGSKSSGLDSCCWYLFGKYPTQTKFYKRKTFNRMEDMFDGSV